MTQIAQKTPKSSYELAKTMCKALLSLHSNELRAKFDKYKVGKMNANRLTIVEEMSQHLDLLGDNFEPLQKEGNFSKQREDVENGARELLGRQHREAKELEVKALMNHWDNVVQEQREAILRDWFVENFASPWPDKKQLRKLAKESGLSEEEIAKFLKNQRSQPAYTSMNL